MDDHADCKNKEHEKKELQSREYQVELFELALEKNIILYLPTGSGKTFIAILLIKHFCNVNKEEIKKPLQNGGKRSFFLVNTVALVEQQAQQIESQTPLCVGRYSGDMNVDLWDPEVWLKEINEKQVLVMTCQIFLDLVEKSIMTLRNVNVLVFDECHRAVSNHPMRQIMKTFEGVPHPLQPRVLGLTATLLNGNIKPSSVKEKLKDLEITFMAEIQTSLNEEMVQMYSTNPQESVVTFNSNDTSGFCYELCKKMIGNLKNLLQVVQIEDPPEPPPHSRPSNSCQIDSNYKKINKRLRNLAEDIWSNMEELGVYGGSLAVLAHLVQVQQMLPNVQQESTRIMYQSIVADCVLLRKYFEDEMEKSGLPPTGVLKEYCSHKVKRLLDILKKLKPSDSAIVFVQRRFTAKILFYLVSRAARIDQNLNHIKCNFIVGYNIGDPFKDTRENYLQRKQNQKVLNMYNQGLLNVLFASNVVEEGVDITKCNYVIQFDRIMDFRGYVQSKGRARDKTSNYIMLVSRSDLSKFQTLHYNFQNVEVVLKDILYGGKSRERIGPTTEELNLNLFATIKGLEPYRPNGPEGPTVTALSAIPLLNRYLASLKTDKFTKANHFFYIKEENSRYKCYLQLPTEAKLIGLIEGTPQTTKENAKRSVALEACKKLHEIKELDDFNLLPVGLDVIFNNTNYTPNFDNNEPFEEIVNDKVVKIGTKRNKQFFEQKCADCLSGCRPEPRKPAYLHVLDMRPVSPPLSNSHRLQALHETLNLPNTFALVSSSKLPQLASFPLYMSTGELEGKIELVVEVELNEEELQRISNFHSCIFDDVLKTAKKFMIRNNENKENSYFIAPVIVGQSGTIEIDWKVMKEADKPFPTPEYQPTLEKREMLKFTKDNYLGRVVSPWYRTVPAQKYLVTDVCYEMTEKSRFPTDNYQTYKEYFQEKYRIEPVNQNQPLLEVRAFSSKLNSTKPRGLTKQLRKKNKEENEEFDVWLLPEFCVVYPLPGNYWMKALLLPSVLHRISQLCLAEELRCFIARKANVGNVHPLPVWTKLKEDVSLSKEKESNSEQPQEMTLLTSESLDSSQDIPEVWITEEEPLDIERNMDTATLFDVYSYELFNKKPLLKSISINESYTLSLMTGVQKIQHFYMEEPPPLPFSEWESKGGPQQVEILQALTVAVANDFINCERLETLGDSFLKFAISVMLFETQPDLQEGHLTNIKGKIVGNKNLYFCGKNKNLQSLLQAHDFSPNEDWVSPGYCIPPKVEVVIKTARINPNSLYNVEIPEEERKLGYISKPTYDDFGVALMEAEEALPNHNISFINQQSLTNKNISDAVEAILGVYLKSNGINGALSVMNWFQITDPDISSSEILTCKPRTAAKGRGDSNVHLHQPELLEGILNYKFRDRSFLLQALTHPSYARNNITKCYQRLEFLGDALIDFLITIHIYHKCSTLSPGDLTDLRSALVNNITLACITVRNQLYKFLLHHSSLLNDFIMRFVKHQEDRNHVIDNDILFLLEENEVNIAETVDVPKALGDIFEALIGAIYLDSGKNLETIWKVIFNLMSKEIESFSKEIPKNHVRMLYESNCSPVFSSYIEDNGVVMVAVEISFKEKKHTFNGFGDNKYQAKRAAAKHALRFLHKHM